MADVERITPTAATDAHHQQLFRNPGARCIGSAIASHRRIDAAIFIRVQRPLDEHGFGPHDVNDRPVQRGGTGPSHATCQAPSQLAK
ncbi:hypothetical protein D3C78_1596270 [compost metagenome]